MCNVCANSGGGWCPCCTPDRSIDYEEPVGFRCDNCGEVCGSLTLEDGLKSCKKCTATAIIEKIKGLIFELESTVEKFDSSLDLKEFKIKTTCSKISIFAIKDDIITELQKL